MAINDKNGFGRPPVNKGPPMDGTGGPDPMSPPANKIPKPPKYGAAPQGQVPQGYKAWNPGKSGLGMAGGPNGMDKVAAPLDNGMVPIQRSARASWSGHTARSADRLMRPRLKLQA